MKWRNFISLEFKKLSWRQWQKGIPNIFSIEKCHTGFHIKGYLNIEITIGFASFVKDEEMAKIRGWKPQIRFACRYFILAHTES